MATRKKKKKSRTTKPKANAKTAKRTAEKKRGGKMLVVVESPAKARTISKYLPSGYTVKATVGHIRDLPQRELGVDIDNGFAPKYVTIRGKGKQLAEIKKAARTSTSIFLATDPDREGEAIAWHVAEQLDGTATIQRVLFHEVTKDAVREAI
ncbi:MAG: toprim domain-containing protein, partial [Gemmatimonadales bacterium]